jgi:hypothetical protein
MWKTQYTDLFEFEEKEQHSKPMHGICTLFLQIKKVQHGKSRYNCDCGR